MSQQFLRNTCRGQDSDNCSVKNPLGDEGYFLRSASKYMWNTEEIRRAVRWEALALGFSTLLSPLLLFVGNVPEEKVWA